MASHGMRLKCALRRFVDEFQFFTPPRCSMFQGGRCADGKKCTFAHGSRELCGGFNDNSKQVASGELEEL